MKETGISAIGSRISFRTWLGCILAALVLLLSSQDLIANSGVVYNSTTGHYYQRIDTKMTWSNAEGYCENQGGYLATVTSIGENSFIYNTFGTDTMWLGGYALSQRPYVWAWVSNETWSFTNWYSGEPSSGEVFVQMRKGWFGQWNNENNNYNYAFVCEWNHNPNNEPPQITAFTATPSSGVPPLKVKFTCDAHDADGRISLYHWDFNGDGTIDSSTTTRTTTHTYTAYGQYNTTVTVEDNEGARTKSGTVTISIADGADLVVTSLTDPPAAVMPGSTFVVTDTAKNRGTASAAASSTYYYLSQLGYEDDVMSPVTGSRSVPVLAKGASSTGSAKITIPSGIASGTYYLVACADGGAVVNEPDEDNNCWDSGTPTILAGPDLIETSVTDPPATALTGNKFSVTDTVKNKGEVAARASVTRYYFSLTKTKGKTGAKILLGTRAVPILAAGASSKGTVTVTIPTTVPTGAYYLLACADDTNAVIESDENNCYPSTTATRVTAAPDLVEVSLTNPPATAISGDSFLVTDILQNQGNAAETSTTTTRYYLSSTTSKAGGVLLGGTRVVPPLAAGASSQGAATVTVSSGIPSGPYRLLACADDLRAVTEGNEDNNCIAAPSAVAVTAPDLVATAVSNPPGSAKPGSNFSVTDTVQNQGQANAGTSLTGYYLSTTMTWTRTATRLTGTRSVPALNIGATSSGSVSVTIPSTTASGAYFLLACADDTSNVSEGNESNNCKASSTALVVMP